VGAASLQPARPSRTKGWRWSGRRVVEEAERRLVAQLRRDVAPLLEDGQDDEQGISAAAAMAAVRSSTPDAVMDDRRDRGDGDGRDGRDGVEEELLQLLATNCERRSRRSRPRAGQETLGELEAGAVPEDEEGEAGHRAGGGAEDHAVRRFALLAVSRT